jgi:hypothetical protein
MHSISQEDILRAREILEKQTTDKGTIHVSFDYFVQFERIIELEKKIRKTPLWKAIHGKKV